MTINLAAVQTLDGAPMRHGVHGCSARQGLTDLREAAAWEHDPPMDDLSTLAGRLRYALRVKEMSARQLDAEIGANRWASRIARGETINPEAPKLRAAAEVLGVSREWLETGKGDSGMAETPQQHDDPRYDALDTLIHLLGDRADPREIKTLRATRLRDGDSGDAAWWRAKYAAIRADRIATDELLAVLEEPVPAAVERPSDRAKSRPKKKGA